MDLVQTGSEPSGERRQKDVSVKYTSLGESLSWGRKEQAPDEIEAGQ
jgi:hypothetical protein